MLGGGIARLPWSSGGAFLPLLSELLDDMVGADRQNRLRRCDVVARGRFWNARHLKERCDGFGRNRRYEPAARCVASKFDGSFLT